MTPRIPTNYIVQIDNFHLGEFIFYWNYYGQPCPLLLQKPKTEGLTAIRLVVDSDEAASFLLRAKEKDKTIEFLKEKGILDAYSINEDGDLIYDENKDEKSLVLFALCFVDFWVLWKQ